ncbi:MAG: A/G-specific adenine glycosylase [Chloroflexota bacterium]|nr:A/G-specific adenine glycosylase [Chloroflexota bacterium]
MARPDVPTASIDHLPEVQGALLDWHAAHALQAPWRESGDPYQALVAAVMAQQTQMSRVLPVYERFMAAFPSVELLAAASAGDVIRAWAGMGYNQRAVRLHRAARQIVASGWPHDAESLAKIDGVGPFTAAIIASFAFGTAAACVDTNVRRVLGRLAGDESIDGPALQALADASIAAAAPAAWNQTLMDYGARICTSMPKCAECVVSTWCPTYARRTEAPLLLAEGRASYDARPRRRAAKRESPFEGSSRYYRGRIIDLLCRLAPDDSISVEALPALLSDADSGLPDSELIWGLVSALEHAGLAHSDSGRISLPE